MTIGLSSNNRNILLKLGFTAYFLLSVTALVVWWPHVWTNVQTAVGLADNTESGARDASGPHPKVLSQQRIGSASPPLIKSPNSRNVFVDNIGITSQSDLKGSMTTNRQPFQASAADHSVKPNSTASEQRVPATSIDEISRWFHLVQADSSIRMILSGDDGIDDATLKKQTTVLRKYVLAKRGDRKTARRMNVTGLSLLGQGDAAAAAIAFAQGVKADPLDVEIVNNLAFARHKSGDLSGAKAAAIAAVSLAPQRANAWAAIAGVLADLGQRTESVSAYILTLRFSKDQEKTIQIIDDLIVDQSVSPAIHEAADAALKKFKTLKR